MSVSESIVTIYVSLLQHTDKLLLSVAQCLLVGICGSVSVSVSVSEVTIYERWGAGVEYHFQEI